MATTVQRDIQRRLRWPGYLFIGATLVFQVGDYLIGILPLQLRAAAWRFAAIGLEANMIGNVLLLILLMYGLALWAGDRWAIGVVGIMSSFAALSLLGGVVLFGLDAIQLRSNIAAGGAAGFDRAAAQAVVKLVVQGLIAAFFAVNSIRSLLAINRAGGGRAHAAAEGLPLSRATGTL